MIVWTYYYCASFGNSNCDTFCENVWFSGTSSWCRSLENHTFIPPLPPLMHFQFISGFKPSQMRINNHQWSEPSSVFCMEYVWRPTNATSTWKWSDADSGVDANYAVVTRHGDTANHRRRESPRQDLLDSTLDKPMDCDSFMRFGVTYNET